MLPARVADLLPEDDVVTVKAAGYAGMLNGELIRAATEAGFDVLVTADRSLPAQQNIPTSGIALVLIPGNRLADIEPHAEELQSAVATTVPGMVTRVARRIGE